MSLKSNRVPINGSERQPLSGAKPTGPVSKFEQLEATLILRQKSPLANQQVNDATRQTAPKNRRYMSRGEFAILHGADPWDITRVEEWAANNGLTVVETDPARRSIRLSGTVEAFNKAFETDLQHYEHPQGNYRGRVGSLSVPAELSGIIEGVFGLDNRPQAKAHFQQRQNSQNISFNAEQLSFTPMQVARLYNFPPGVNGNGQCIGIIELGGGYRLTDMVSYFSKQGLPIPEVKEIEVDGAKNRPSNPDGPDGEVMLDLEVAASVAPRAKIAVYFAPNTDRGFLDAVTKAIHDEINQPSVISISWGAPESFWTQQALQQFNQEFEAAATMGVTVCCAAGDNGSSDGYIDGKTHVDFPASSPYALACGGTRLVASGGKITSETVWNDGPNSATGGGISEFFPAPGYQSQIDITKFGKKPGRGVPDVAGDADPMTGYQVRVDGREMVIGGTSAVAPLWSGLIALINHSLGQPVGFINPLIYNAPEDTEGFHDITNGNNGSYSAGPGWDLCTGWGSPIGTTLLKGLES